MEIGKTTCSMGSVFNLGRINQNIKDNLNKVKDKVKGNIHLILVLIIKDNGKMEN